MFNEFNKFLKKNISIKTLYPNLKFKKNIIVLQKHKTIK